MEKMKILIACEFSGVVRQVFAAKGHDVTSCDLLPSDDDSPNHVIGDVVPLLTQDWDMIIAHPPCTYLCRQANRWIESRGLEFEFQQGCDFFNRIKNNPCSKICIENPIPHRRAKDKIGNYTHIIQPYQFGHDYSKKTCLWLKGLPKLNPTKDVELTYYTTLNGRRYTRGWYFTPRNSKARSRTFQGIGEAMAEQWG